MKVFISWSGDQSRLVAEALRPWLRNVINAVEPFMSEEDIEKGAVGTDVIASRLQDSEFGIICITHSNQERPWINYEAGALSKTVNDQDARVATLLIDINNPAGVTGPLSRFQATKLGQKSDIKRLIAALARAAGDGRERTELDNVVDLMWPSLESALQAAQKGAPPEDAPTPHRTAEDMFAELVNLNRQLTQAVERMEVQPNGALLYRNVLGTPHRDESADFALATAAAVRAVYRGTGNEAALVSIAWSPSSPRVLQIWQLPMKESIESELVAITGELRMAITVKVINEGDTIALSGRQLELINGTLSEWRTKVVTAASRATTWITEASDDGSRS